MALNKVFQAPQAEPANEAANENQEVNNQPNPNEGQENVANEATSNTDDLFKKVTSFVREESPEKKSPEQIDDEIFNDREFRNRIEQLEQENPDLANDLKLMRKSALRGVNDKFQEIAEMRKQLESIQQTANKPRFAANSIEELLNNPEFVKEAQRTAGIGSEDSLDDDEYLSDAAKKQIAELKSQVQELTGYFQQTSNQQSEAMRQQQHQQLSNKYGNYNPQAIDEITKEMLEGKIQAGPEHIYKAFYHDDNVQNAYEVGYREGQKLLGEKKQASSFNGYQVQQNGHIRPEKGESNEQFGQKVVANILASLKK